MKLLPLKMIKMIKKSPLKIIITEKLPLEILYDGRGSLPVQRPRQPRAFHSQARLFTSPSELKLKPQTLFQYLKVQ